FFKAEDGIRDKLVTGVQTCALPISHAHALAHVDVSAAAHSSDVREGVVVSRQWASRLSPRNSPTFVSVLLMLMASSMARRKYRRSEERRVGKECRCRWWREHRKGKS